jgi:1-acyl-sn-glycerol-3-phosphate acyltransferase
MTDPSSPAVARAAAGSFAARALRYCVRVPWLLWHVLVMLPLTVVLITPLTAGLQLGGMRLEERLIRAWSGGLLRIFGFRIVRVGAPLEVATMFVANHVTWADIVLLHSQKMMGFVAKAEIARWPVVGWMAARAQTIFHQRGSTESLGGVLQAMLARLRSGHCVGVFPEGRTRDGREVGPFHARIFLAAVESGAPVQPVALRYGRGGDAQAQVAFQPGEHFLGNFVRLLGEPARPVEVHFLVPILANDVEGRRGIAERARDRIVAAMAGGNG